MAPAYTKRIIQLSLCRVAAVKRIPVHWYNVVTFKFSGPLGLLGSDIWKQNTALAGAKGRERCCIFQYLSSTDSIKSSLLFSNFEGSLYFRRIPFSDHLWTVCLIKYSMMKASVCPRKNNLKASVISEKTVKSQIRLSRTKQKVKLLRK